MEDGELEISISIFFSRWEIHQTQYAWDFFSQFFVSVEGDVNDVIWKDFLLVHVLEKQGASTTGNDAGRGGRGKKMGSMDRAGK